jgi:hypothetical protein
MMKAVLAVAAVLLMSMSVAYAKPSHGISGDKATVCWSNAYQIEALFKCDQDEFIAPDFSVSPSPCRGEDTGVAILEFNNSVGGGRHLLAKKLAKSCSKSAYSCGTDRASREAL